MRAAAGSGILGMLPVHGGTTREAYERPPEGPSSKQDIQTIVKAGSDQRILLTSHALTRLDSSSSDENTRGRHHSRADSAVAQDRRGGFNISSRLAENVAGVHRGQPQPFQRKLERLSS